ncbi:hypothetical protein CTAYLR_006523 [Chrysophaeum taylorii]|uniref:Protein kinase domain-containing protein n=1 Tax=Chrysophaeum taylorii TaxID=2483200 RepID=A0AAD7UFI5_9STRA|nr:hypothetical protein CTAYLR_006523 [Chrysophaeum taylorii]
MLQKDREVVEPLCTSDFEEERLFAGLVKSNLTFEEIDRVALCVQGWYYEKHDLIATEGGRSINLGRNPQTRAYDILSSGEVSRVTDADVKYFLSNQVTSVNLVDCLSITDSALQAIAANCSNLTNLNVSGCENLTDFALEAIAANCSNLTKLNVSGCGKLTDDVLHALAANCSNLTSLDVSGCGKLTGAELKAIVANCSNLTRLKDDPVQREEDVATTRKVVPMIATEGVGVKGTAATALASGPSSTHFAEVLAKRRHQDHIKRKQQEEHRQELEREKVEQMEKVDELIMTEKKSRFLLKEFSALLKRAFERFDDAAVQNAREKVLELMDDTSSLALCEEGFVLQLLVASFADETKTIEALLEKAPTIIHETLSDVGGACWALSALHVSAMRGNLEAITKLKNMNGDFTISDARKRTPLHHAAARGHANVVLYLVKYCGVDVNAVDCSDRTALMHASYEGFLDVVVCLVDVGNADVNAGFDDDYGDETAIDLAMCRGHTSVVRYLEKRGARRLSRPIKMNTSSAPMITQTLRLDSVYVGGVGRTARVRLPSSIAENRSDQQSSDFVAMSSGCEDLGFRVDQRAAKKKNVVAAENLWGTRQSFSAKHNHVVDSLPTKPTKTQRSLGVGKLDVGYLVRLPTTGRPVFEVVDFIAQGAHGEVYVVRSMTRAAASFAMKRVRSDELRGASVAAKKKNNIVEEIRLCREALLMAELGTHPHIVSLHYCVVSGSNAEFLLFMTLVDGARDLERLVSSGDLYDRDTRLVRASIFSILQQLASALAFCHSRGVLHQDVKLENVLVDTVGRAYLGDFGLARHGDGVGAQLRAPLEGCTPAYASPEVIAALDIPSGQPRRVIRSVSPAETDIWAFGVVALLLYHGDEEGCPEMQTALESIQTLQAPEASWGRLEVRAWLQKHSLSIQEDTLDGAALFTLSPNNLHDALPWLPKKRDRARLRRMLLAPPPAVSILLRQCLAAHITQRPTCGAALLELMQVPATSTTHHHPVEEDVAGTLLNIGRAVVELEDVELACRALEAAAANGGDAAECYSLIACAHVRAGSCEEALVACDRALSHDAEHGGALFAKAEATYRHDSSDSLFLEVVRRAQLYDAKLFPAPRVEKGAVAYLEAAKDEADWARDPVTDDRVSVSKCVRNLPPKVVYRRDVKTDFRGASPSTTAEGSSVRGALADVLHTGEGVEAAMRTGRVVIEGDAGSGKGWILRAVVVALCKKQLDNVSGESSESEFLLPLTIPLSSIEDPRSDWVGRMINNVREGGGGDALRAARIDRRLVLCLDGLDEVAPTTRPSLVEKIVEFAPGCALTVITSRPAAGNIGDLAPHGFAFLSIAQVDRRRVEALTGIPPDIASFVETPLALRLALLALSSPGELQTPPVLLRDRSDLFRIADEGFMARALASTRQDGALALAREVLQERGSVEVREVLERLALVAHQDRRTLIQRGDLEGLGSPRLAAAVWSLARSGLLPPFAPRGSSSVAFFHLTFQEYYVALILGLDSLLVGDLFDLGDPWWQSPALFAFQLAEPGGRESALAALARKIPAMRLGETVEVFLEDFRSYRPHIVASLDEFGSSRKIGVKEYSWSEQTQAVSVERVRRDVAGVAAFARRAAAEGETALVVGLVDHGADLITTVDSTTKDSSLHAAARSVDLAFSRVVQADQRAEMVRLFWPPKCDEDLAAHPIVPEVLEWLDANQALDAIPKDWDDEVRLYAFAQACHRRQVQAAATLAASIDANGRFPGGGNSKPLHFAVVNSCIPAVSVLLERGARLHDGIGESALELASRLYRTDALSMMLQDMQCDEQALLLHPAALFGFIECVELLVEKGADVDKAGARDGVTPLYMASLYGHVECVQLLIEKGADFDKARTDSGATPLYGASYNGHVECVQLLIEKGADVDKARTDNGATPLYGASYNGHVECVRLLIEKGADVNKARTDIGATPLFMASENGHVECVQLLIDKGAYVDKARMDTGGTPLFMASKNGDVECVRLLIDKGADVNKACTDDCETPLYVASHNGRVESVRLLISKNADVNKARTDGATPLHAASRNGHLECVQFLIAKGADIKANTFNHRCAVDLGDTLLEIATFRESIDGMSDATPRPRLLASAYLGRSSVFMKRVILRGAI